MSSRIFTSFLSVYKICKMFLDGQPVGCIAFTFDHLTHSTHPPKLNSKPLHVLFLYIWPHVVPSHLSSPRQKRTDRQAPNGTFGGRARIGQSIRLFNWGMFISKTEPPSTKKYEKLSRQVLSQAFLQRICWFLILQIKLDESPNLEISRCFPELELGTLGTLPSARRKNNYQAVQECVLSPTCFEEFKPKFHS